MYVYIYIYIYVYIYICIYRDQQMSIILRPRWSLTETKVFGFWGKYSCKAKSTVVLLKLPMSTSTCL